MRTTIKVPPVLGFSVGAGLSEAPDSLNSRAMLTTEDGERFTRLLDQISDSILVHVAPRPDTSKIRQLLVVIGSDSTADVYLNELGLVVKLLAKDAASPGGSVRMDSVVDAYFVSFDGVEVPSDAGVVALVTSGSRRGVYYDLTPVVAGGSARPKNSLESSLACLWTYLVFQDRTGLTESDLVELSASGWFPFIGLPTRLIRTMVERVRSGVPVDALLEFAEVEVQRGLPRLQGQVLASPVFEGHRAVIARALEHFEDRDFVSAATMLYPRIEGLLRDHRAEVRPVVHGKKSSQVTLAESVAADPHQVRHANSLLLPGRFADYLRGVYFASFLPEAPRGVNRNTVGHGVAPESELDLKAALLAVLIVEQLAWLCGPRFTGPADWDPD